MKYPVLLAQRLGNKLSEVHQLMDRHNLQRMTKVTSMVFTLNKALYNDVY